MPDPVETERKQPLQDTEFDPLEFWIRYRRGITVAFCLILTALVGYALFEYTTRKINESAADAFAKAQSVQEYQKVAEQYPHSASGGDAALAAAQKLRQEGKFDESIKAAEDYISKFPKHPLISAAYVTIGGDYEAVSKQEQALSAYQKVTAAYPNSFVAPVAWLGQGRVLNALGKLDEAKRAYDTVVSQYKETPFAQEAQQALLTVKPK